MSKPNRREFLQGSALGLGAGYAFNPINVVLESIVHSILNEARAQSTGTLKNFVSIRIDGVGNGGADRTCFDSILAPQHLEDYTKNSSSFIPHPAIKNYFDVDPNGNIQELLYKTVPVEGENGEVYGFPWLWRSKLPNSKGDRWMTDLAQNMMVMRGFKSFIGDGHEVNRHLSALPVSGKSSIHGLNAEQSNYLFPAVFLNQGFFFYSGLGKTSITTDANRNTLKNLFEPINLRGAKTASMAEQNAEVSNAIDTLIQKIRNRYTKDNPAFDVLYKNREKIIKQGQIAFENLVQELDLRVEKYQDIITKLARVNLNPSYTYGLPLFGGEPQAYPQYALEGLDARPLLANNWALNYTFPNQQPSFGREPVDVTTVLYLANNNELCYGLAAAEFLLEKKYSNTFHIHCGLLNRFAFNPANASNSVAAYMNLDQHGTDTRAATYYNSKAYQMLAGCLLEFNTQLTDMEIFDDTVVWLTSEFNRRPRYDGTGSEHGYDNQVNSVWSGAIKAPIVAGNIERGRTYESLVAAKVDPQNLYPGTIGTAAMAINPYGNLIPTNKNVNTTLCELLGIPPFLNNPPYAKLEKGIVKRLMEAPKNVG